MPGVHDARAKASHVDAMSGLDVRLLDRFSVRASGRLVTLPTACQRLIAMVTLIPMARGFP